MIAGSNTPPIYYTFFCDDIICKKYFHAYTTTLEYRFIYIVLMYSFCFACFVVMLVPKYANPEYIVLRGTLFVMCGLLSCIPIFHMEFFLHEKYLDNFICFPWAFGGILYIIGAVIYMLKIPERFRPGKFDICVSLIFNTLTIIGVFSLDLPLLYCVSCISSLLG